MALTHRSPRGHTPGWSSVNTVMGGSGLLCAALWFAKCVEVPQYWRRRGDASSASISSTLAPPVALEPAVAPKKAQAFNFGIFRDPAVIATTWCNMSTLNCMYTMSSYVPTIFIESLNCTPMQAAAFLVLQSPIRFIGGFVTACTESALLKKGVSQINIRKQAQMLAAIGQSAFMVAFAFCKSAPLAALCINAETVFSTAVKAGFDPNMIEIGGDDTATLNAVGNTLGTSWGLLVPILAAYCKSSFGSYAPVFIQAAVFHLLGSLLFFKCARLTSRAEEQAAQEVAAVVGNSV